MNQGVQGVVLETGEGKETDSLSEKCCTGDTLILIQRDRHQISKL